MHKKLKKYIHSYDMIEDKIEHELTPNGGMIVLINQETNCNILIDENKYTLENFQGILINANKESINIKSNEKLNLIAIRFKGAGASFFYEDYMDELMNNPEEPIFLETNISKNELDDYFQNRFKASKLPFNIMKIIDLLDEQKSNYNIDEILAIANVPRKILDKMFRLKAGLTFKTYASIKELGN